MTTKPTPASPAQLPYCMQAMESWVGPGYEAKLQHEEFQEYIYHLSFHIWNVWVDEEDLIY